MRFQFLLPALLLAQPTCADIVEFHDENEWLDAVDAFSLITFTEFPPGTIVTDQYQDLGVTFTTGDDGIFFGVSTFPDDHHGLSAGFDDVIEIEFDIPMQYIGVVFPGFLTIEVYSDEDLVATDSFGSSGANNFGGYVTEIPFNRAVMYDPLGFAAIDDLMFGPPIPAPGALPLLGLALLAHRRRRRR